jgi:UDPglucose 6-dehydrogenase
VLQDKRIAVWGLTFKPDTDDVRNSVAVELVNDLLDGGALVSVYDPKGMDKAREQHLVERARFADSPLDAVTDAEALVLATEWAEFAAVDLAETRRRMHTPLVFDGRNLFDPATMRHYGFQYYGIGRRRP